MKSIYCLLLLYILCLLSCSDQKENSLAGTKIVMPAHVEIYNPLIEDASARNAINGHKKLKVYALVDASCATCLFKLNKWDSLQSKNPNVAVMPVCFSKDNFEQLKFLFESSKIGIKVPLILDIEDSFAKQNKAAIISRDLALLTDGEDRVLFSGSLLDNEDDQEKFHQAVSKLH
jgi:hypothetical protein